MTRAEALALVPGTRVVLVVEVRMSPALPAGTTGVVVGTRAEPGSYEVQVAWASGPTRWAWAQEVEALP